MDRLVSELLSGTEGYRLFFGATLDLLEAGRNDAAIMLLKEGLAAVEVLEAALILDAAQRSATP